MKNVSQIINKQHRYMAVSMIAIVLMLILAIFLIEFRRKEQTYIETERLIAEYISERMGKRTNEIPYSIGEININSGNIYAVGICPPIDGEGFIFLLSAKKLNGKISDAQFFSNDLPLSRGVAIYKSVIEGKTIIYGAVDDKLWLNLSDEPIEAEFTEVSVLYEGGEKIKKIKNFESFLIRIDGNVTVDDVIFKSNSKTIGKLSEFPIGDNVIENFNSNK